MGDRTGISWTDSTWNPVTGCSKVSPGCEHCYAEREMKRWGHDWQSVQVHHERLEIPMGWKSPRMIFVCSVSDLFHPRVPFEFIDRVFATMEGTPWHTYQLLSKRPGRMAFYANGWRGGHWPGNVWAGTSIESAKYLPRLDVLARVPAKVHFVSCEPLLEQVDLSPWLAPKVSGVEMDSWPADAGGVAAAFGWHLSQLQWVIVGGESGPKARPMQLAWVQAICDQCRSARIPFFFKQWGGLRPGGPALLEGHEWREFPA